MATLLQKPTQPHLDGRKISHASRNMTTTLEMTTFYRQTSLTVTNVANKQMKVVWRRIRIVDCSAVFPVRTEVVFSAWRCFSLRLRGGDDQSTSSSFITWLTTATEAAIPLTLTWDDTVECGTGAAAAAADDGVENLDVRCMHCSSTIPESLKQNCLL